jgi:hypothetical protein
LPALSNRFTRRPRVIQKPKISPIQRASARGECRKLPQRFKVTVQEVDDAIDLVLHHLGSYGVSAHPYEQAIIRESHDEYAQRLAEDLNSGRYFPDTAPTAEVPKGGGAIRPVQLLSLRDQIVYALIGQKCLAPIARELGPDHKQTDYSYHIKSPSAANDWFLPYFRPWQSYRNSCLRLLEQGTTTVVETDISGFYENVDHAVRSCPSAWCMKSAAP